MPVTGNLYVFIHGLTVVSEKGPPGLEFEIALPDVRGHVTKAGNWLSETPIAAGADLRLTGVTAGTETLSDKDFLVRLPACSLTRNGRAATLRMPRPSEVLFLLRASSSNLATTKDGKLTFGTLATIQILVYPYTDINRVQLQGHYWEPCPVGPATGAGASLHIISTSETPEGDTHMQDQETALYRLIRGYPGLSYKKHVVPPAWNDPSGSVGLVGTRSVDQQFLTVREAGGGFAFALVELEPIASRTLRLARLGHLKQQAVTPGDAWHEPDPVSEGSSGCDQIYVG